MNHIHFSTCGHTRHKSKPEKLPAEMRYFKSYSGRTTNIEYKEFFDEAKSLGIPFTIHSGECGNANNIAEAVELGAKRIGHGIHSIEDEKVLNIIKEKNIL